MSDLRQAAIQALEEMLRVNSAGIFEGELNEAIAALKQALAEPEQPVAVFDEKLGRPRLIEGAPMLKDGQALYTAPTPRQWVSLTEQEMYDLFFHDQYGPRLPEYLVNTIKCVEAALKEKNNG